MIEKAGVIMFKDASANKGGVTSSSLEVLAALVLTDDEFRTHMAVSKAACAAGRPADRDVRHIYSHAPLSDSISLLDSLIRCLSYSLTL